tara:strand:- start:246 stop:980 length:735 start_codon:yes stop_codon:yes gene_type:complete
MTFFILYSRYGGSNQMEIARRFLHFPVPMLIDFLDHPKETIKDIFVYSVYAMLKTGQIKSIQHFEKEYDTRINEDFKKTILTKGKQIFDSFNGFNYPYTGIHLHTAQKFLDPKTEIEYISLLAFLALKSIIQKKAYQNAKDTIFLSRMAGSPGKTDEIPKKIIHWMKSRSRRSRVFLILEQSFGLVRAYKARGISYSFTLTQEKLELTILRRRPENKKKEMASKKRIAKKAAQQKLQKIHLGEI